MADIFASLLVGIGLGIFIGIFISNEKVRKSRLLKRFFSLESRKHKYEAPKTTKDSDNEDDDEDLEFGDWGNFKMVFVVRQDLGMGKGKAAAQCCHAAVAVYNKAKKKHPEWVQDWEQAACPKIVLKAPNEETMLELAAKAYSLDLDVCVIRDAGRTQIAPGSKTVMGLGPAPSDLIDQVTGQLKLFQLEVGGHFCSFLAISTSTVVYQLQLDMQSTLSENRMHIENENLMPEIQNNNL